jgi:hypothetical protein
VEARRRELQAQFRRTPAAAGVYRIVNAATGRAPLGSTTNLASVRSRPEMTPVEVQGDLATLEQLWRERLDPALLH